MPQAYAVLGGKLLNGEMIERGWACASPFPAAHRYREAFDSLQRYAKNLGLGIWATAHP
jgi:endonuclease YncB( thermonuclease family)